MPLPFLLLLAAADASANSAGALWITGGLAATGGISTVVSIAALFATRREVEALEKRLAENVEDLKRLRGELQDMERRLNLASESRAAANHERTNEILAAVARLGGQFDQQTHNARPH